jgi:hypothetical protein
LNLFRYRFQSPVCHDLALTQQRGWRQLYRSAQYAL